MLELDFQHPITIQFVKINNTSFFNSTITFTFLCTTFFKKANSGAAGAGVLFFLTYLPFIFISLRYESLNFVTKIITCFVNNLAMSHGLYLLGSFEGK